MKEREFLKFKLGTLFRKRSVQKNLNHVDEISEEKLFSLFDKAEDVITNKNIPIRVITKFNWYESFLTIEGYMYIDGIPLLREDTVRKKLLIVQKGEVVQSIPLKNHRLDESERQRLGFSEEYEWAGFYQEINFSKVNGGKPLPHGNFHLYLELEVLDEQNIKYHETHTLGNINQFLKQDIYATKMEHFSGKKRLKYNFIVTYDEEEKTAYVSSHKLQEIDQGLIETTMKNENRIIRKMKRVMFQILYQLFCILPVKQNKITFASDSRTDLSGNFEFVYQELLNRDETFDFQFFLKESINTKKSIAEYVQMAYHFATSRQILIDDFYPIIYPLKIRKNADLVQLWHAVGAFKTFGYSRIGLPGGPSPTSKNHRNYTKVIVSSDHIRKHYAEGFGVDIENVIATGVPRTDFFFDEAKKAEVRSSLYEEYPFLKGKKVILFAPTFRGNGQQSAHYPFEVLNYDQLYQELNSEYIFLFKIHPFVKNQINIPYQYSEFFYDFSDFREINELLLIADVLITDYSSVCFEFALLQKPMIFFSYDVDEYIRTRDFYYEYFSFIPGPLARTCRELVSIVKNNQYEFEKLDSFVQYFFDELDGQSSKRVVDAIFLEQKEGDEKQG
ncbi:CDP-glycerol glycerophosphotransferase family protein [Bacillus altitudinis]|uniref:CDP-glycerol glycerophosphotransferase family protein n=1 Tax=Bacillus altitudinis TaxID=293387 RepID=UPI001C3916AB|nr:CDP-glycerol glycerophosphotransferase family protein [Bacillus altitudinis]MBW2727502.1 CDP-glycerol glycerophosphotransferase family protein [Bacillus altitudinis]